MTTKEIHSLVDKLPKMSPQTMKILRALSKPGCSIADLTAIAEQDPAMSARILRVANSATFGRAQTVRSVRHAITIQGVNFLRKLMLGLSVSGLFSRVHWSGMFSMVRFNLHSVATATLMDALAEELPVENADHVFLAGLLHDTGEMLIALNRPTEYDNVLAYASVSGEPRVVCERKVLGMDHAFLSAEAARHWQLDDAVCHALEHHHTGEPQDPTASLKLSNLIQGADRFVDALGISILPPTPESLTPPILEFEGFSFDHERVYKRFEEEWKKLSSLFA